MHDSGKKLLQLMFREGETISVSPNKYGYHSVELSKVLNDKEITLVPTEQSAIMRKIKWEDSFEQCETDKILLAALNPIKGFREDANCYKYRNFLIEMDTGTLPAQLQYVKTMGMPYSAVIFSGNKSLHFLISLDEDLANEDLYRYFSTWIIGTMTMADQNTINPSRSIRVPGAYREPGKLQGTVEFKGPVKLQDLVDWLKLHPDAKPMKREERPVSDEFDWIRIKRWVKIALINGIDNSKGRNKQWFSIACEFALAGYDYDDTIGILDQFFVPDRDFKHREWKTTVKSAFKHKKANR